MRAVTGEHLRDALADLAEVEGLMRDTARDTDGGTA